MLADRRYTIEDEDGEWIHLYLFEDGEQMCGSLYPVNAWKDAEGEAVKDGEAWLAEIAVRH